MNDDDYAYVAAQAEAEGRRRGWNEALEAAREAVARLKRHVEFPGAPVNYIHPDFFLAAIDALRENP